MSDLYATKVNQKLAFARILKTQLPPEGEQALLREANLEAMCFHLYSAFRLYLGEIAAQYNLPTDCHQSIASLQAAFATEGRQSPEVNELAELEARKNSWLQQLQTAYGGILVDLDLSALAPKPSETPLAGLIAVTEVDSATLTLMALDQWQLHIAELIARHRESMLEY